MAITVTFDSKSKGRFFSGSEKVRRGTISLNTYATNGIAIAASDLGLRSLDHLDVGCSAGIIPEWDKTNGKIKAYRQKDPAAAGGADIALPEVTNAIDLSAVVFRFHALGK